MPPNLEIYFDILAFCSVGLIILSIYFALKAERYKRKLEDLPKDLEHNHLLNSLGINQTKRPSSLKTTKITNKSSKGESKDS